MAELSKRSPIEIADDIITSMEKLILFNDALYFYNGKHYELCTDSIVKRHIHNYYCLHGASAWTPSRANNIAEAIKYSPRIELVKSLDEYDDYINLKNGILQFSTKTLQPHSDEFYFTSIIEIEYDPSKTEAPVFMSFLDSVFTDDKGYPDTDTIQNIIQLGGYLIYPQIKMEKLFIFYGTGANGKSILIDYVFKKFFDRKFMSALSLNTLSNENSTARKQLLTSRLNISTEQKSTDAIESEELKKVITGEDISIERKYDDTIMHQSKCKNLVAGNRFMRFKDTSDGTRRRLMIFNFKNKFETSKKKYLEYHNPSALRIFPAKNKDELIAGLQGELTAILNIFLEGLQILKDNNWRFEESENNEEVFKEYLEESDYLGTWLTDNLVRAKDQTISAKDIVESYRTWWNFNFPDKRFDVSTKLAGRRIKDIFRQEPQTANVIIDGKKTTTSLYNLKFKQDPIWDIIPEEMITPEQPPLL